MTGFVQIIEYKSSRYEEIDAFLEEFRRSNPESGPSRVTVCRVQGQPTSYTSIVEFPSYEDAERNNHDPRTQKFADMMMRLCDGPPVFHDLDVLRTDIRTESGATRTTKV